MSDEVEVATEPEADNEPEIVAETDTHVSIFYGEQIYEVAKNIAEQLPPVLPVRVLIAMVKRDIGFVAKTRTAETGGNYQFRGIDDVYDALDEPLASWGLLTIPRVLEREYIVNEWMDGTRRRAQTLVRIHLAVDFEGPLGDKVTADAWSEAQDYGDKATAKAMSVAFRTIMFQTFTIPVHDNTVGRDNEDDNDEKAPGGEGAANVAPAVVRALRTRLGKIDPSWSVEHRSAFVSFVVDRPVESLNDLTLDEANAVLEAANKVGRELKLIFVKTDGGYRAEVEGAPGSAEAPTEPPADSTSAEQPGSSETDGRETEPSGDAPGAPGETAPADASPDDPAVGSGETDASTSAGGDDSGNAPMAPQEDPEALRRRQEIVERHRSAHAAEVAEAKPAVDAAARALALVDAITLRVEAMDKPQIIGELQAAGLKTSGTLAALKTRLTDHLIEKEGADG